jgi:hypothetical protein
LGRSIRQAPVQVAGHPHPTLSRHSVAALTLRIAKVDPGRIRVAVVSPLTQPASGDLAQALSDSVNRAGVVIVAAGGSYHVTTTWGSGNQAQSILADAVGQGRDSLYKQLRRAVDGFAKADAAAGHPSASGDESRSSSTQQSGSEANGTPGQVSQSGGGESSGDLLVGLIALGVVLALVLIFSVRPVKRSMRASRRRKEIAAEAHRQAQADLVSLGEDIAALDIDSSMPNASAHGNAEYGKAIECYQDAERRLANARESYQFERAVDALRRGHEHVQAAAELFAGSPALAVMPTPQVAPTSIDDIGPP